MDTLILADRPAQFVAHLAQYACTLRAILDRVLASEELADGSRAVIVFSDEVGAETYRIVEELGPEWQTVADSPLKLVELLKAAAATGVRYVALDPPTSLTLTREIVEAPLVPLEAFIDSLLAGG